MAAPPSKTINDLNGKWVMNKSLSDSPDNALALQGISWFVRKGIALATVTLDVKQYVGPPKPPSDSPTPATHIDIEQTATAGIKGTSEYRCLDWVERAHTDWMFGTVVGQTKWVGLDEVPDQYLRAGWEEGEVAGPEGKAHVWSHVVSEAGGWTADQIWGFQIVGGERRYCRNIVVANGEQREAFRLVYDFVE